MSLDAQGPTNGERLEHEIYQVIRRAKVGLEGVALYYEGMVASTQLPEWKQAVSQELREQVTEQTLSELLERAKQLRQAIQALDYFESKDVVSLLEAIYARQDFFNAIGKMVLGMRKMQAFLKGESAL